MLELVFAPCSPIAGGKVNWIGKSDEEIIEATMRELERLFPTEIGPGAGPSGGAQVKKYAVVKVPRSVYAAVPGRNKYRPSQETPVRNLTLCGDWTSQKFLGSMEGAVLAGKLAAEVIVDRTLGRRTQGVKLIEADVVERAADWSRGAGATAKEPIGIRGDTPIAFGGGMVLSKSGEAELKAQDATQLEGKEEVVSTAV